MKVLLLLILITTIGFACQQRIANSKKTTHIHSSIIDANKLGIDDKSNQKVFANYNGGYSGVLLAIPNGNIAQKQGDSVYVSAFYMDATEVCNLHYRAFMEWTYRIYMSMPQVALRLLPDTSIWLKQFPNESIGIHLKDSYFRSPAFDYYPIVGVSWQQAQAYALWRTDRINEAILAHRGHITADPEGQQGENHFDSYNFLNGMYEESPGEHPMINASNGWERRVLATDDILLPYYRLPTAAQLKQAAKEVKDYGNNKALKAFQKKIYDHTKIHPKPTYYDHQQYHLPYSIIELEEKEAPYHTDDGADEWTQVNYDTHEQYNRSCYPGKDADGKPQMFTPIFLQSKEVDSTIINKYAKQHTANGPYRGFRCVMPNLW